MRTAFFAHSTFLRITRDKCSFSCHAMPHAKSLLLLLILCRRAAAQKFLTEWMFPSFSFSRDDDDQMIAGKEFQTIPRHSRAATVRAGRVSECGCFVAATFESVNILSFWQFLKREATWNIHCLREFHLLCRHPLRSVVEVRSSYHSGSFVRRPDAWRGRERRFIIVWGQEKIIVVGTLIESNQHVHIIMITFGKLTHGYHLLNN